MNAGPMSTDQTATHPRAVFLLIFALAMTLLFLWLIKGFLLAVFMAAVMAGLLHPLYRKTLTRVGQRKGLAAGITVLLSLVLAIIPTLIILGMVMGEATEIAGSAKEWIASQKGTSTTIQNQWAHNSYLKELLPYQDQIAEKGNQLIAKGGSWVAQGLAAGVKGTASFFLGLFVMLYAMAYFLTDGKNILETTLRYTPLSADDQKKLLGTFVSVTRATLKGKLVVGIVQGGLAGLSFWVAGIDGVFFWSAVMAVFSVIPSVGTAIIWFPAVVFLAVNGQVGAAVGVGLWCALVVGSIDNILNPILIGKDTEMPDLLVLLTTLGGLAVFGVSGLIIGPIIGSLFLTVWKRWGSAMIDEQAEKQASLQPD